MINPVWLKTFVTLIDTGHFTKTAEKLFMTQPGVTQHIKKLEQACGYPLIERHNKSFDITEAGRNVYQHAIQLERQESELLNSLNREDPFSGSVSLSCSGSLALLLYPHLLNLQCKYSQLIPRLEAAPHHKIVADVLSGATDIGIVTQIPSDSRFESEVLGNEPLCLLLPKARATKGLGQESLKEIGLIQHPDAIHYLSIYFAQCGESELEKMNIDDIPVTGYINQLSQILLPVANGLGFTVLPKSALDSFAESKRISIFEPSNEVVETLYFLTKKHRQLPKRFETIKNEVVQHFQQ
ncbi:LysR family transcriptional regulator [Vibrio europaeus]|uniref:LysR family transcriptional regulator n=1 Tax=Vibrio europaeus TaxID=300876 RepID=A0A178J7H2_9VIBR|nr:LysR family transcriptional regulator [Vibrio europaeus]MDC5705751.1 LysR family transcriptional regulator [Vibrio europaeus]MDC5711030.1 LysR family transcriptional regulator [Vibrio europaeus]MDC5716120.1 LysR family transcriptional regulator [Vibrio europaeus]MDC5720280.1 LysR family transcriptional regulator [Vibrio europaeus]MDC5723833.1 LysR family transcriptional regulator [Vibrio europaeus]